MSDALLAEAGRLRRAGRFEEAGVAYRQVLARHPHLADSWYNLAWVQRRSGHLAEALASYRRALDEGVREPEEVHLNCAAILSLMPGREEEALPQLQRALALNPNFVPALLNLGNFEEDRGRRAEARDCYRRALSIEPDNSLALARLAEVSDGTGPDDAIIARLRAALERPGTSAPARADLGFALGKRLDAAGAYDAAFSAFVAANAASRESLGPHRGYDRAGFEQTIDKIIAAFDAPARPVPQAQPAPLFICGMFRSGSTLAEQILASHSNVVAGGELDIIPDLIRRELGHLAEPSAAIPPDPARLASLYRSALGPLASSPRIVTDKRPDNFLNIGQIKAMFPNARIVHTRRNPLDNLLSLYFLHLDPDMAYAFDLLDAAHRYRQHERLMTHWRTLYPDDIFELDYDQLVREPQATITRLLDFAGLEVEEACFSFHETARPVRTASVWQVRRPLYQSGSGRWRNYRRHLGELRRALDASG